MYESEGVMERNKPDFANALPGTDCALQGWPLRVVLASAAKLAALVIALLRICVICPCASLQSDVLW